MSTDYQIPILLKTMKVVDLISENKEGLTFAEILVSLKYPKTTLFRILQTLEAQNWLAKKADRYSLGYMMIHYGLIGLSGRNIRMIAPPYLEELRMLTTETAHLAVLSGNKSMIIEICESQKHIKPSSPMGSLIELYCSAHGKVFLSYKIRENLADFYQNIRLVPRTSHTITDIPSLEEERRKIIKNGYAVDDMEYFDDVRCLAAPVWGKDNEIVGAVGITATTADFPRDQIPAMAKHVVAIAKKISREMGSI
jgi:DNA-binding IclR family transcriptional regulator